MRKVIEASEGKILTNGSIFGKRIYPANDENISDFWEISYEEYLDISEKDLHDRHDGGIIV